MTPDEALEHMKNLLKLMEADDFDEELCPIYRAYVLEAWGRPSLPWPFGDEYSKYHDECYETAMKFIKTGVWR